MKYFTFLMPVLVVACSASRQVTFRNSGGQPIWISPLTNDNGPPLDGGIQQINAGATYVYQIPDGGWAGRFWPKTGCDSSGQNCKVGQSTDPCPAGGCEPPAETKVEFNFPQLGNGAESWYDISLVDGYSCGATITPSIVQGTCVVTNCKMSLADCPTNENDIGDLRVMSNGQTIQCLSPCKKWNYPKPYGLGNPETQDPGKQLCCPTPPVSSQECNNGAVVRTQYVNLVHNQCPSAYSFAYDDKGGLHNCPNEANFEVNIFP